MLTSRWNVIALLFVVLLTAGCGSGQVKVYPVKGKITYGGKPMVGGGAIALIPLGVQEGKTAGGHIAEDGTYSLTTYKDGDGSMPGEFRPVLLRVRFKINRLCRAGRGFASWL